MAKQMSLDAWKTRHLAGLLERFAEVVLKTGRPIVLFRHTLEESDGCYEEVVCTLTAGHVIEQVVASGGMVAPSFRQQSVFGLREYPRELLAKSQDRFLELIEFLEGQDGITVNKDRKRQ